MLMISGFIFEMTALILTTAPFEFPNPYSLYLIPATGEPPAHSHA